MGEVALLIREVVSWGEVALLIREVVSWGRWHY